MRSLLFIALFPVAAAYAASDLSIATAASGNASGACAVTGDGRSRVVIRCTGQPEFEAQVTDAIGTLLPTAAVILDEEVSTPGYAGSTTRSSDLTLSHIVFTPKPSVALERAGQLEREVVKLGPLAKRAGTLEQENSDLKQQLAAARSLAFGAPATSDGASQPVSLNRPPAIAAHAQPTPVTPPAQVPLPDSRFDELLVAVQTQGKELAVQAEELRRLRAERAATIPAPAAVPPLAASVAAPAIAQPSPTRSYAGPVATPPQYVGVATRTTANPLSAPVEPLKWYARLDLKHAQAKGAHYVTDKAGHLVLVMGPFDSAGQIADLARLAIYPIAIVTSLDLAPAR